MRELAGSGLYLSTAAIGYGLRGPPSGGGCLFKRREDGTFKESVNVGKSLAADREPRRKQLRSLVTVIRAINPSRPRRRFQEHNEKAGKKAAKK